jgi:type IV pilus assembly protein PilC
VTRGLLWTRPLQRFILRIPTIGPALQTVALARLAWVMSQTMNTTMDVQRSLKLSLQSTRNARYIDRIAQIDAQIAAGNSIYEAFCEAGVFPADFLASIHVGEQSGNLVESMAHVSNLYQDQARAALNTLATVGGFAVWVVVAGIIICLIFRLAMFYLGVLSAAGRG